MIVPIPQTCLLWYSMDFVSTALLYWPPKNKRKSAEMRADRYSRKPSKVTENTHKLNKISSFAFSVAPMMDWTDRHCRMFHRLMTRRSRLYTEMLTTGAILHGDRCRLLAFDRCEHPVALQLGGSDPKHLAASAKIGEDFGYDEINLNVGCPSDRVKEGRFGACLMAEPLLVADGVAAMKRVVRVP